jgi:putative DNA primase/helicase
MNSVLVSTVSKTDRPVTPHSTSSRPLAVVAAAVGADPKGPATEPPSSAEPGDIPLTSEDTPGLMAYRHLYEGQGYVNIYGEFHRWAGSHYQEQRPEVEKNRIATLLTRCVQIEKKEKSDGTVLATVKRPYAHDSKISDALRYCLSRIPFIPLDKVNPGGLNLRNGVLTFDYSGPVPQPRLEPHSRAKVYTYCADTSYDSKAPRGDAHKLLEAIPADYRPTPLRLIASAIDLPECRKKVGRGIRAQFWAGEGSNGKDAVRTAVSNIFGGNGVTGVPISAFTKYDKGEKPWGLAPLLKSRINWPSENSAKESINKIESLKMVVTATGQIDFELKNKNAEQFTPKCICIFNTNDTTINLDHRQEAMASRYIIVPFPYRFTDNPTGPNDLKADSRFIYDEDWVRDNVCPGLLNILVEEFQKIFTEGIDYKPFEKVLEDNLENSSHLYQFKRDSNLIEDESAKTTVREIWARLRSWYESEEILSTDSFSRDNWVEDTRPGDKWIKTTHQLGQKLAKMFPAAAYRTKKERGFKIRFMSDCERALRDAKTIDDLNAARSYFGVETCLESLGMMPEAMVNAIDNGWITELVGAES